MHLYTGGTFDLFHAGHVNFLKRCKDMVQYSGLVTVSLNTDEFIERYKGKPPVCSYAQRAQVLTSCRFVDRVIPNEGGEDSKEAILKVKPTYLAIGSDWATKDYYKQMGFTQDWLDSYGIALVYIPYTKGVSSSEIKTRL
jgi:glycerol-3-phosphate cytidylyltransferase